MCPINKLFDLQLVEGYHLSTQLMYHFQSVDPKTRGRSDYARMQLPARKAHMAMA
jgi:hypothetical protein